MKWVPDTSINWGDVKVIPYHPLTLIIKELIYKVLKPILIFQKFLLIILNVE